MTVYTVSNRFSIPEETRQRDQWVCWRWEYNWKEKRLEKVPINPHTGKHARTNDPATWGSYADAIRYAREHKVDGLGFVFVADDPFCGIDLDGCRDPETGELRLGVAEILDELDSYAEVSPSGTGIHAIVKAAKPGERCSTSATTWGGKIEMYDRDRFFTVTGRVLRNAPATPGYAGISYAQEAVNSLYKRFLTPRIAKAQTQESGPHGGFSGDDEAVSERLEKARNNPHTGAEFRRLYDHGIPDTEDRSAADFSLCRMLAFWFAKDPERIKALYKQSALAGRKYEEKGRHGEKYLDMTVDAAIRRTHKTYDRHGGSRLSAKVREIVSLHREAVAASNLPSTKKAVMRVMHDYAGYGKYQNDGTVRDFNANQQEMAGKVGMSQRGVGKVLQSLVEERWLIRVRRGSTGKNSTYQLPPVPSLPVETSSTTYTHTLAKVTPPVEIRSRTNSQQNTVVAVPFIDPPGEVATPFPEGHAPTFTVQEKREMVRNMPPLLEHPEYGLIHEHGPECACWWCGDDAPEYVPVDVLTEQVGAA